MNVDDTQLQIEVLQPEISGEIQKTTSEELKTWIKDGKLKPNHQLRVKSLPWMEAQKIPAFQILFESLKDQAEIQSNNLENYPISKTSAPKLDEPESDEATALAKKLSSLAGKISIKPESDDSELKKKTKNSEPSLAYKLFEEKALARSKKNEAKPEASRILPDSQRKPSLLRKTAVFLAGCVFLFLLSLGGAYFWVYQLKAPAVLDEKAIPELSSLENKLTSDKLELRLRKAEREKELIAGNNQEPVQQIDFSKEVLNLENQFNIARKEIIKNRADKLQTDDFNATFYFSFAVCLSLFLLLKVFYGRASEPLVIQNKPALDDIQIPDELDIPAADETFEPQNYQRTETTKPADPDITKSPEESLPKLSNKIGTTDETPQTRENSEAVKTQKSGICILHLDRPSNFVCEGCDNHLCADCTVTLEDDENCCPFCRFVCQPLEEEANEAAQPKSEAEEKKKLSLLELYGNSNYKVRDFPDQRTKKIGVITAFFISLAFSISISIFWVYKISPYLENRRTETSQNTANVNGQTSEKLSNKTETNKADNPANEPCIDPQTRQPFECDEETRRALEDHTKKVKSVEKAQSETAEKTDKILGLVNPTSENTNRESLKPNPVDEARKETEKQQLIKIFICSFLAIFGSLMLTRLFSKDKLPE